MTDLKIFDIKAALTKVCKFEFEVTTVDKDLYKVNLVNKVGKVCLRQSFFLDFTPMKMRSVDKDLTIQDLTIEHYKRCEAFLEKRLGILPDIGDFEYES